MDPPLLEAQSSFAENEGAASNLNTEPAGPARFDPEDLRDDLEESAQRGPFETMFECHSKNLVEFVDKKGIHQRKTQEETMNDIVLYIQDHSDFYEAWENVFRGEVPDY